MKNLREVLGRDRIWAEVANGPDAPQGAQGLAPGRGKVAHRPQVPESRAAWIGADRPAGPPPRMSTS
jgi:hypothetical protein